MSVKTRLFEGDPEAGAAGKVMLIIVGAIVLVGIAVVALWQPVIKPLIGEAYPVRVENDTELVIPWRDPLAQVTVPAEWTMQRALYNPQRAVIRSPDLKLELTFDTWQHGAAPSLKTAIIDASATLFDHTPPRLEQITETLVATSVIGSRTEHGGNELIAIFGVGTTDSAKGFVSLTGAVSDAELDEYLPTIARILASVEATQ